MNTLSQWIFWGGMPLAIVVPFLAAWPRPTAGRIVLGLAVFSTMVGLAFLLSATSCVDGGSGVGQQCPSGAETVMYRLAGAAGILQGALLLSAIAAKSTRVRRLLIGACVPLSARLFYPLLLSIGPFLILGAWTMQGWLVIKGRWRRGDDVSQAT